MVVLATAVFISTLGFALWVAGLLLDLYGIATLGAVMIVGVGAMQTIGGLEYKTGEVRTNTSVNETVISNTYTTLETPNRLPLGFLVMLSGALMSFQALNRASEQGGL